MYHGEEDGWRSRQHSRSKRSRMDDELRGNPTGIEPYQSKGSRTSIPFLEDYDTTLQHPSSSTSRADSRTSTYSGQDIFAYVAQLQKKLEETDQAIRESESDGATARGISKRDHSLPSRSSRVTSQEVGRSSHSSRSRSPRKRDYESSVQSSSKDDTSFSDYSNDDLIGYILKLKNHLKKSDHSRQSYQQEEGTKMIKTRREQGRHPSGGRHYDQRSSSNERRLVRC